MPVCKLTFTICAFAFPIFFLTSANPVFGSAQINQPIQVTTHPGEDFASTLSADGKLMIFVSDRSGFFHLAMGHGAFRLQRTKSRNVQQRVAPRPVFPKL